MSGGGLQVIKDALLVRQGNLFVIARNVGTSAMALDDWARGDRETLPIEIIHGVVDEIWNGFIVYLPDQDVLAPRDQEPPRPLGILPQLDRTKLPVYTYGANQNGGPRPEQPTPQPKSKSKSKPGWKAVWR